MMKKFLLGLCLLLAACAEPWHGEMNVVPDGDGYLFHGQAYPVAMATDTPLPTETLAPTPTETVIVVPTDTATSAPNEPQPPTDTPTATATNTPVPPTATPTSAVTPTPITGGPLVAFPGAEGYGAQAIGGRGGKVYIVNSLADSGAGTLRECMTAVGPRTCVFAVAGTIELKSTIEVVNPYLTVAGQTAPGGGITVKAAESVRDRDTHIKIRTYEVILRYFRIRPGTKGSNARALSINGPTGMRAQNVVIDHMSLSWAGDEILISWDDTQHVTFSWNNMSESLPNEPEGSVGLKGPNLGKETGGYYSVHHNLMAHHSQRLPNISAGAGPVDVVNNVMYNPGGTGTRALLGARVNFVNNYIKAGPNTTLKTWVQDDGAGGFYHNGNVLEGIQTLLPSKSTTVNAPYAAPPVSMSSADLAYEAVLANAGAVHGLRCDGTWFARPDAVDARIVQSVRDGTTGHSIAKAQTFQSRGYISTPEQVGGWPSLSAGTPCVDHDQDGMPTEFELLHMLDPQTDDANTLHASGYTWLEVYLGGQ